MRGPPGRRLTIGSFEGLPPSIRSWAWRSTIRVRPGGATSPSARRPPMRPARGTRPLPFFVVLGPLAAIVMDHSLPRQIPRLVGLALIAASWPWLLGIFSRPIIPTASGTNVPSVLRQSREDLYYVNVDWVAEGYRSVTARISENGCSQVGLVLSGQAMEYLLWAELGAPRDDLRLEWFVSGKPSARSAAGP